MESPIRILAVDNEPSVTLSLRFVFSDPRYELTCVQSGQAALAQLDPHLPLFDIILVDERMPGLSGTELVRAIRHRGIGGKIIALSAFLTPEVRETYQSLGVVAMFRKPFNVQELRTAVDRFAR